MPRPSTAPPRSSSWPPSSSSPCAASPKARRSTPPRSNPMPQSIRRIVTGHDAQGRSNITFEGDAPNIMEMAAWPGARITELWVTSEAPADNDGLVDRGARPIRHDPEALGTIFRTVEIPPESEGGLQD